MYPKGFRRGRWAGLTTTSVAHLMNLNRNKTGRLLHQLQRAIGRELTLEDIGELVLNVRSEKEEQLWLHI